jgi:hypothetical protein
MDAATSGKVTKSGPDTHPPENKALAAERLADQRAWVQELFSEHRIMLGSGTPVKA